MTEKRVSAVIDRIEGVTAVLAVDDGTMIEMSKTLLPPGCKEGDALVVTVSKDDGGTTVRSQEAADIIRRLSDKNKS